MVKTWARECWPAWGVALILFILLTTLIGPWVVRQTVPMSRYYELRTVTVSDTRPGVSPSMVVDRTIHQDFRGRRDIEIKQVVGSEFEVWWDCGPHVSEWRTYRAGSALPADLNLDWWMRIPPLRECPLPVGTYKVISTICAQSYLGAEVCTTVDSNVFSVQAIATGD